MKNYELLDMIGEVNEDYALAADSNVIRPRFRWKALAACAACAVLALCAYPVWTAAQLDNLLEDCTQSLPPLHAYTVVEGGGSLYTEHSESLKAPAAGADDTMPGGAYVGDTPDMSGEAYSPAYNEADSGLGSDMDGAYYSESGGDVPVQAAAEWYDALLSTYRLEENPEWYGGAWTAEDRVLAVAIVDGFRTPELEADLQEAAGAGAVLRFSTVKYSMEFLQGLMDPVTEALDGSGLTCGIGADVTENCLGVDIYSDGNPIPDAVLARLAELDPDGDAIQVRLFTGSLNTLTDDLAKGPAPGGDTQTAQYDTLPGKVENAPQAEESSMPAIPEGG